MTPEIAKEIFDLSSDFESVIYLLLLITIILIFIFYNLYRLFRNCE